MQWRTSHVFHAVKSRCWRLTELFIFVALASCYLPGWAQGNQWIRINSPGYSPVAVDALNSGTVYVVDYVAYDQRLFKSTDHGTTWSIISQLPTTHLIRPSTGVLVVDPRTPNTIYAGGFGLFKSTDGGATWLDLRVPQQLIVSALATDPQDPNILYAATHPATQVAPGEPPKVFKSINGGATWIVPTGGLRDASTEGCIWTISALAVDPVYSNIVYATTSDCNDQGGVLWKSTDGGSSWGWDGRVSSIVTGYLGSLAVDSKTPGTIYVSRHGGGIGKSTDRGETWKDISAGLPLDTISGSISRFRYPLFTYSLATDPQSPGTLYVSSLNHGIFKSTDAGASWTPFNSGLENQTGGYDLVINSGYPRTVYARSFFNLFRVTDYTPELLLNSAQYCVGDSWTLNVTNGLPNRAIRLLGSSDGQAWEIATWRTTDSSGTSFEGGTFNEAAVSTHTLSVDIGGALSLTTSFVVRKCN